MSANVSELIGRIIHPKPGAPSAAARPAPVAASGTLDVLIGRIVAPQPPAKR